jgi:hypothetical protein
MSGLFFACSLILFVVALFPPYNTIGLLSSLACFGTGTFMFLVALRRGKEKD